MYYQTETVDYTEQTVTTVLLVGLVVKIPTNDRVNVAVLDLVKLVTSVRHHLVVEDGHRLIRLYLGLKKVCFFIAEKGLTLG